MQRATPYLLLAGWLALLASAQAVTNAPAHTYPCGMEIAFKIGHDLVATLDPKFQRKLHPEAIIVEQLDAPVMAPTPANGEGFLCQVSVSTGFIDLLNHVAHAKAIDKIQPGYFHQYVAALARQGAGANPSPPPELDNARYWTDAVMQDQVNFFNQMISMTLALNLSHLYLEHYDKYAAQTADEKPFPINDFIAPNEWQASVKYAAANSLDCALPAEGAEALFDCIDQLPRHPVWADYIVPQTVNIKKLNLLLAQYEHDYYYGSPTFFHPRRTWTWVAPKDGSSAALADQPEEQPEKP
jgi:hypothetical protein